MDLATRKLGTTPYTISRVGLGAWAIGGGEVQGGWGPQDDDDSIRAIRHAVDTGVNWIDTAPAYGFGHAEEVVGQAVRQIPEADRPLVFTKCGLVWEEGETTVSNSLAPESIRRECDASLRRLGVDVLDLLQAHWPTWDDTPIEESWAAMAELVDQGKVRHIGLSNFTVDDLQTCERVRHVDTFQPELNLIARDAAADTIPWCGEHDTGVIVYSPMKSGLLSGRFSAERVASMPEDDWRTGHEDFTEPKLSAHLALVDRLRPISERHGMTLPEVAIAWTLAWPAVTAAIVGARNPEQVDGWVRAGNLSLEDKDLEEISSALEETGAGEGPHHPTR